MQDNWIKLHRELIKKPIWLKSTPQQKTILITLLSMVNWKSNGWEWKGKKYSCNPGQMITSLNSIKKACGTGISIRNIRTALVRFEKLGFLTKQTTRHYDEGTLITIGNWGKYQSLTDIPTDIPLTYPRHTPDKPLTTIEEGKESKEGKIDKRKQVFFNNLIPHTEKYGKKTVRKFYEYWTELNKSGTKMRFEKEGTWELGKRLARWKDNNFNKSGPPEGPFDMDKR